MDTPMTKSSKKSIFYFGLMSLALIGTATIATTDLSTAAYARSPKVSHSCGEARCMGNDCYNFSTAPMKKFTKIES
jgi:hypothetical protein